MSSASGDPNRLETLVTEMRSMIGVVLPSNLAFSKDGKRLYFIDNGAANGPEICYANLNDEDSIAHLEGTPLLGSTDLLSTGNAEPLSKEEALRRERMRASLGLHTFSYEPATGQILVPASPTWFVYNTDKSMTPALVELKTAAAGARIDPKLSPKGGFVSFVRDNDLWVQSLETLEETRITKTALPSQSAAQGGSVTGQSPATASSSQSGASSSSDSASSQSKPESAGKRASGVAEYCMQEEFDRYTGYWWAPASSDGTHSILHVNIDESHVTTYNIATAGIRGEVDKFVYPLAGDENAHFSLSIADFETTGAKNAVVKGAPKLRHLTPSLKERFPWCEYIPRLGFSACGRKVWVQMLDRQQQHSMLVAIDVTEFKEEGVAFDQKEIDNKLWSAKSAPFSQFDASAPLMSGVTLLHTESTNLWINVTELTHWYADGSDRVIIASELCGKDVENKGNKMRHLYMLHPSTDASGKKTYTRRPITEGETWQVDPNMLVVDEKKELVYFMGTKDSPLESHLYVASTAAPVTSSSSSSGPESSLPVPNKSVQRLTPSGCYHSVTLNHDRTSFVTCYSNVKEPHRIQIFSIQQRTSEGGKPLFPPTSSLTSTLDLEAPLKPSFEVNPPELFNFKNSLGETVYGCYYKPRHFDPSRKYPTILKVYGGPHVQYVSNDYKMTRVFLPLQLYAHLGFLVVMIDGVGSWRRGLKYEGYLRNCMGTVEVQEQVEGLTHLIKSGIVDPERIAVTGWSYGGYLSLLCLAQRPDFFKVAISGAPVTVWESYDTAYTERYMDTPENNPQGYANGSVFKYVPTLPDQPNRLLIIHGNLDENVHICNTFELIQYLIDHNKPYQLQVFPNERHGVRNPASARYNELVCLRFFLEHL